MKKIEMSVEIMDAHRESNIFEMQIPRSPTDTLNIDKDKYYESLSFGE
jgi:hypothetical protein